MVSVSLQDERLLYSGRIDDEDPQRPVFIFPASSLTFWFYGKRAVLVVENHRVFWDNYVGAWVDGKEKKWKLKAEGRTEIVLLDEEWEGEEGRAIAEKAGEMGEVADAGEGVNMGEAADAGEGMNMGEGVGGRKRHEVIFFKRQDCCHSFSLCSLQLSENGCLLEGPLKPARRMEVYGDSVSAGEVSEAVDYVGKPDPEHEGEYSNSWYSYAWIAARKLGAELYDIAQGGIPLLNGTGWVGPTYPGMEFMWDKLHYHPGLGKVKEWDFSRFVPHLVLIAVGQNDSHPVDVMKEDIGGERARFWKKKYRELVENIRGKYPKAVILLATTILEHHRNWDLAIDEVCEDLRRDGDERVFHFLYSRNGCGTPGHIRIPEAEEMAEELVHFIEGLSVNVWDEEVLQGDLGG